MSDQEERAAREAELWRQIVDNFGERATLDDEAPAPPARTDRIEEDLDADPDAVHDAPRLGGLDSDSPTGGTDVAWDDEGHFVPPEPVPGPLPEPRRMLAWIGVLGVPMVAVVLAFTDWSLPRLVSFLLFCWCVGGFGYLVATMRRDDDGWDDGARV